MGPGHLISNPEPVGKGRFTGSRAVHARRAESLVPESETTRPMLSKSLRLTQTVWASGALFMIVVATSFALQAAGIRGPWPAGCRPADQPPHAKYRLTQAASSLAA